MQYGFYINQKALVEVSDETGIQLDLKDAVLIEFIAQYSRTPFVEVIIINGRPFYWVAYQLILDQCPLLKIESKEVLARRLLNISKAGILDKHYSSGEDRKTYFAFGANYAKLIAHLGHTDSKVGVDEQKPSSGGAMPTQKSYYQYTTTTIINGDQKNSIDDWQPSDVYNQTIKRVCPDLTDLDLEGELLGFKDFHRKKPPKSFDRAWLNWCNIAQTRAYQRNLQKKRIDEGDQLARERMKEFDEKKRQNIQAVGSKQQTNSFFTNEENMENKFKNGIEL